MTYQNLLGKFNYYVLYEKTKFLHTVSINQKERSETNWFHSSLAFLFA